MNQRAAAARPEVPMAFNRRSGFPNKGSASASDVSPADLASGAHPTQDSATTVQEDAARDHERAIVVALVQAPVAFSNGSRFCRASSVKLY